MAPSPKGLELGTKMGYPGTTHQSTRSGVGEEWESDLHREKERARMNFSGFGQSPP